VNEQKSDSTVTDAEIETIIAQDEAGVADLIAAYEPIEAKYFQAVNVAASSITYSANTTPR
jgi:hypothetical protein